MSQENASSVPTGSLLQLVLYWAVVGVPLAWGVYKTVVKLPALL